MNDNQFKQKSGLGELAYGIEHALGALIKTRGKAIPVTGRSRTTELTSYSAPDGLHLCVVMPKPFDMPAFDDSDRQREIDDHQRDQWIESNHPGHNL